MTICYSRPRNLREALTKTSLSEPEGERVSDLINSLDPSGIRELENNELNQKNYLRNSSHNNLPRKLGMSNTHSPADLRTSLGKATVNKYENAKATNIRITEHNMYIRQDKRENIAVPNPVQMRICEGSEPTQRQAQIVQTTR
jgi:hypothetical protein